MARIFGYIAASLDGFIADADEGLDWLDEVGDIDYGEFAWDRFIAGISTFVMGRGTYDWLRRAVTEWPHPDVDTIVVTSHPLPDPPDRVSAWREPLDELIAHLRSLPAGDAWMAGGGQLQSAFVARGALDHLQIFVMPVLIGAGVPLWTGIEAPVPLELEDARHIEKGVVRLAYRSKTG